ncbi:MAG: hypothetical protein J0M20_04725, partial [Burkholderiales bacterium]|nr:hypothetical protein [Burkholderiales bacterium]
MASAPEAAALPTRLGALLRPGLGWAMGFSGVLNLALLTPSLYMLQVYDRVLVTRSVETLLMLSALALVTLLLLGWVDRTRSQLLALLGLQLEQRLAAGLLQQRWRALARREGGVDGHRELQVLRQALTGPAVGALMDAPWMPVYLLLIYAFDVRLGLLATACAALLLALALRLDYLLRPEGFVMDVLEKIYGIYFTKDERTNQLKIIALRKEFQKVLDRPKEQVLRELYRTRSTFGVNPPANHERVMALIDGELPNMDWHLSQNHLELALAIPQYIVGNALFQNVPPRPDRDLF